MIKIFFIECRLSLVEEKYILKSYMNFDFAINSATIER